MADRGDRSAEGRAYYAANRERILAAQAERLRTDPEFREARNAARRAKRGPWKPPMSREERLRRRRESAATKRRAAGIPARAPFRNLDAVARVREWRETHPARARAGRRRDQARRRARLVGAAADVIDPQQVWDRDGGVCGICGEPADPTDWHLDHVIPLARGGDHVYANVQVAHSRCNIRKGAGCPTRAAG